MNASTASQRAVITVALAVLLLAGVVLGIPTPQREPNGARLPVEQTRMLQPHRESHPASIWAQLTQLRGTRFGRPALPLTPPQQVLNESAEFVFVDTPLMDAIGFISDLHNTHVVLDGTALEAAGISPDIPVNMEVSATPLRDALEIMLRPLNLRYAIQGDNLVITTTTTDRRPAEPDSGHFLQAVPDVDSLIELIQAETSQTTTDEFSIPPAVSTADEISDTDRAEILNRIISDVLQSPDFQETRGFYGTPGKQSAVIVTDSDVKLPPDFKASVSGWNFEYRNAADEPDPNSPRVVAIRFDKFAPHKPAKFPSDGHVAVCIFNGGGNLDGNIHSGGCFAFYRVSRSNEKWTAECVFAMDP